MPRRTPSSRGAPTCRRRVQRWTLSLQEGPPSQSTALRWRITLLQAVYGPERVILDANGKQIAEVGTWGIQRADGSIDHETLARRETRRPTLARREPRRP